MFIVVHLGVPYVEAEERPADGAERGENCSFISMIDAKHDHERTVDIRDTIHGCGRSRDYLG